MFERRLKIILLVMFVTAFVLLARAMHVQIAQRERWTGEASKSLTLPRLIETTRGRILDRNGEPLAVDEGCIDACVDYRALRAEPDAKWVRELALQRVKDRLGEKLNTTPRAERIKMRESFEQTIRDQIRAMWKELARLSGKSEEEINQIRGDIESRVTFRKRVIWYARYARAMSRQLQKETPAWYQRWLMGDDSNGPNIDSFAMEIGEETAAHVILPAIDKSAHDHLAKNLDRYPGLVLKGGSHRIYPFGDAAAHVIGNLGKVNAEDLQHNDDEGEDADRRAYQRNDRIGRSGLEMLAEPMLRGARGKELYSSLDNKVVQSFPAVPGQDVRATLDISLQQDIQKCFHQAVIDVSDDGVAPLTIDAHGAAVVLDVRSGEVLALVSNPSYDLNKFDESYGVLLKDAVNAPLMNRATQSQLEPGSTAKLIVGIGAISAGLVGINEGIECTGAPVINKVRWNYNKCWTVSHFASPFDPMAAHHMIPFPHRGHDGNPDGFLTFSDALCRSCNVYFVQCADRLGIQQLSSWMQDFGLGRPTGIGIAETRGRLPSQYEGRQVEMTTWSAGIGQGSVWASPLQMANVAATIARDGVWLRPRLLERGMMTRPYKPAGAGNHWDNIPDQINLPVAPEAVRAAKRGMIQVVNDPAGTGTKIKRDDLLVAGKTGTAQASALKIRRKAESGELLIEVPRPGTLTEPNPQYPWYLAFDAEGKNLKHAWFIGFAPANDPKIAFAVMVQYGGGGGATAGPIAARVLDACIKHGYLPGRVTAQR